MKGTYNLPAPGKLESVRKLMNTWLVPSATQIPEDRLPALLQDQEAWRREFPDLPLGAEDSAGVARKAARRSSPHGRWWQRLAGILPALAGAVPANGRCRGVRRGDDGATRLSSGLGCRGLDTRRHRRRGGRRNLVSPQAVSGLPMGLLRPHTEPDESLVRHARRRCRGALLRHDREGTPVSRASGSLTEMPGLMLPRGRRPACQQTRPFDAAVAFSSRSIASRLTFFRFVYRIQPLPMRAPTNSRAVRFERVRFHPVNGDVVLLAGEAEFDHTVFRIGRHAVLHALVVARKVLQA